MKTKLIAILTAMTMVFAMAPLTMGAAFADDEDADSAGVEAPALESLEGGVVEEGDAEEVGDYETKGLPSGCVMTVGNKKIKSTTAKGKGWTFKYKKGTGYLTLNKATINKTTKLEFVEEGSTFTVPFGIYCDGMNLKITLKGKNKMTIKGGRSYTIGCEQNLTIAGKGSLTVTSSGAGIQCMGKLNVKNATVSITGKAYNALAGSNVSIYKAKVTIKGCPEGLIGYDKLTIKNSKVTSSGKYNGVSAYELSIKNSKLTLKGNSSAALDGYVMNADKSTITATSPNGSGVDFDGGVTLNNSILTAKADHSGAVSAGTLTLKNSKLTATSNSLGVYVDGKLQLIKTSKGKYTTRLEATATDTSDGYYNAVTAGEYDISDFRITTPAGGTIDGYYIVDANGVTASHVVIVPKKANTLSIKGKTATVKYSLLQTEDQTLAVDKVIEFVKKGQGPKLYSKVSGNENILVEDLSGTVTVKAGLAKGTYKVKIKVTAAGNDTYKAASKTVTATITVK